ncbi:MAG: UDP-N-acetylmuramoyl-tripeptide--D-alanyl-D-alanine ligase [Flavobacteriales bacterium]|nr:UDP-N-acetylmuramoyl-tripeptide--D-alanyl-D-alanine ligase [Flavobacteriales bacterium]
MASTDLAALHARFLECTGACTDTRKPLEGGLFFALRGPNFNANNFAAAALEAGCRMAVVDDPEVVSDQRFILVDDVLDTLQELARYHRRQFDIPVIGITGSNGKTTTKELMYAVLSADRPTLATAGNLNNHIGVPLTLLRLNHTYRTAIVEMGANKVGDISELVAIAEPTHGLITNIGYAHIEGFGGIEGVLKGKTELYAWIREHQGRLYVNADDALLMEHSAGITRTTYGTNELSEWRGTMKDGRSFLTFAWEHLGVRSGEVITRLVGAYNLSNALAAVCVGGELGVSDTAMAGAIQSYEPGNARSQFIDTGRNHLVMDAYNANPTSMKAALEHFAAMPGDRPKMVILGGMKELGESTAQEHQRLVDLVKELGLDAVYVGREFPPRGDLQIHPDAASALAFLEDAAIAERLILIKGSRGTALEKVLPAL